MYIYHLSWACEYRDDGQPASNDDCALHMAKEMALCWPSDSWSCAIGYQDENPAWNAKYKVKGTEGNRKRTAICDKLRYDQDCSISSAGSECEDANNRCGSDTVCVKDGSVHVFLR